MPAKPKKRGASNKSAKGSRVATGQVTSAAKEKPIAGATVRLTHPERVVYPEQGITKRDLANYYLTVADWMLPHVIDRPLSVVRCPEGLSGTCFYQKHPPPGMPTVVDRVQIQEKSGSATYVVIRDVAGLITLMQFGALEIHAWGARADDIEHPDRVVFDLDPDQTVPWKQVVEAAETIREVLNERRLKSFIKTTGGNPRRRARRAPGTPGRSCRYSWWPRWSWSPPVCHAYRTPGALPI